MYHGNVSMSVDYNAIRVIEVVIMLMNIQKRKPSFILGLLR